MYNIYFISHITHLIVEKQCLCQFLINFIRYRPCINNFNLIFFHWGYFTRLITLIVSVQCIILSVFESFLLDILRPNLKKWYLKEKKKVHSLKGHTNVLYKKGTCKGNPYSGLKKLVLSIKQFLVVILNQTKFISKFKDKCPNKYISTKVDTQ